MEATTTQPMKAYIRITDGCKTTAVVDVFGRQFVCTWCGGDHYGVATQWVAGWNKHLDREWALVKASGAEVMERFVDALQDASVPRGDIETAIRSLLAHAKQ